MNDERRPALTYVRAADYDRIAWKNGGGTTADIDVVRHGSRVAWRLSLADIELDGPFSDYAGYDRTIVLAEGHGFALETRGVTDVLDRPYAVHRFDGARAPLCRLLDGPARALNVLTAQATHVHDVSVPSLAETLEIAPNGALYVVMLRGGASIRAHPEPVLDVQAGDTVRACGLPVTVRAATELAVVAVVRIRPRVG